jgi:hypothetical protein
MSTRCESCGAPLPEAALLKQCGRCVISSALNSSDDATLFEPQDRVGEYELRGVIGRGGMGVVYRARRPGVDRDVALKMILAGAHASFDEVRRFELEAESAATLEHPNIVPVYEVGEHDGLPWFVMRLMDGGSLSRRLADFSAPSKAASLVATIARAVRFGHRRGVIHRDLKPDNILFDAHDTPYVADFGVARRLGGVTDERIVAGTPGYLAPEAMRGEVTTQADVYALGAILCKLLSGRPPTGDGAHLLALGPPDLAAVCRKALEPGLERRYASADALARDLDAFLNSEPVSARKPSVAAQTKRWVRAHPFASTTAVAAIASAIVVTTAAIRVAEQQESELRERALQANAYAARVTARWVHDKLQQYARIVEQTAERATSDEHPLEKAMAEPHFDSWLLLNTQGVVLERKPMIDWFNGTLLENRDYVRGVKELGAQRAHKAYVSEAFVSGADRHTLRFAIAAPRYNAQGEWVGKRDEEYEDDGVRWLAGMARVESMPLVVIVQTKWEDAAQPSRTLLSKFAADGLVTVVMLTAAAAVVALVARYSGQQR